MDIRKHAVKDTATIHIKTADNELMFDDGKPVTITVFGPGSKQYSKAQAERQVRLLARLQDKKKAKATADDLEAEQAQFLADCTHSTQCIEMDGKVGADLHLAIYSERSIGFIADQVNAYLGEWGNFTEASTKT